MDNLLQLEIDMVNQDIQNSGVVYLHDFLQSTITISPVYTSEHEYYLMGTMYMKPRTEYCVRYKSRMFNDTHKYDIVDCENEIQIVIGNLLKKYCNGDNEAEF